MDEKEPDSSVTVPLPQNGYGAEDVFALLSEDEGDDDGRSLIKRGFPMAAQDTRHVWDTPEEDEAWSRL